MNRLYPYVGPAEIRARCSSTRGTLITSVSDFRNWLHDTAQIPGRDGWIAVTFVIDQEGRLRVADRHSEHVACAGGEPVRSAGEMFLAIADERIEVMAASNQSSGYCPEPESWPAVAAALDSIGVAHPGRFTDEIVFRRCLGCGERNIVKDGWFVCGSCGTELPADWNF